MTHSTERFTTIRADLDFEAANEALYQAGMTDGLPVIPPTPERVARMLEGARREPGQSLGVMGPGYGKATIEKIAVNAVMAGCRPEYMPVLVAAVEAMLDYEFNLYGINATTHPVTPMLVLNGPVAGRLKVNSGYNCMGPGWRANATIGRAIRLILVNIAGGTPGNGDRATHGTPAKFSFCLAENELASPWAPLHVRRGFSPGQSTVTVHASEAPHEINNHTSEDGGHCAHLCQFHLASGAQQFLSGAWRGSDLHRAGACRDHGAGWHGDPRYPGVSVRPCRQPAVGAVEHRAGQFSRHGGV